MREKHKHKPLTNDEILARLSKSIEFGDCWVWNGYREETNYGRVRLRGKNWATHRLVYTILKGEIPEGMHLCHTCDNPPCCNPDHLWPGTPKENTHDSMNKGRRPKQGAYCLHGHPFGDNPKLSKHGVKICRTCVANRCKAWASKPSSKERLAEKARSKRAQITASANFITYHQCGQIERWTPSLKRTQFHNAFCEMAADGKAAGPWMTYKECQSDAKARGCRARFERISA